MDPNNLPKPNQPQPNNTLFAAPDLPTSVPPQMPKKRGSKKLLFAGIAIVSALLICGLVFLLTQKKPTQQAQNITQADPVDQIVQSYIQAIRDKDYAKAYAFTAIKGMDEESFTKSAIPYFVKSTKVEACEIKADSNTDAQTALLYCPYVAGGGVLYEYFTESQSDGSVRIVKIERIREDKANDA